MKSTPKTGIALGIIALLIHWFCPSGIIEVVHGQWIFPAISWVLDHTINLLPIPMFYFLLLGIVYLAIRVLKVLRKAPLSDRATWYDGLLRTLNFLGLVIFVFYFFWGYNYDRVQLVDRLGWSVEEISETDFLDEGFDQVQRLRDFSGENRQAIDWSQSYQHYHRLESIIRDQARQLADSLGYLNRSRVQCRQLRPSGLLLRISTAGFYNPLTGECNIDKGLHILQKPFVMAHEFFHGMGVSGEGDCNFLAYVLCHRSEHDFIRYSGELSYWRYMRYALRSTDRDKYEEMLDLLPEVVVEDMKAIDEQLRRYPDIAPRMRDAIYSAYLRSNKIDDGMANYSRILQMVVNWRKQ